MMFRQAGEILKDAVIFVVFVVLLMFCIGITVGISIRVANAQEMYAPKHHPQSDITLHDKFYSKLVMPDNPNNVSCCDNRDCRPVQHRRLPDGTGQVLVGGQWLTPPPEKILRKPLRHEGKLLTPPDASAHLCSLDWTNTEFYNKGDITWYCVWFPYEGF